ncbi:MAG: hypothetical protein QXH71_01055 [Candidatus Anstonellaceae archaeon]
MEFKYILIFLSIIFFAILSYLTFKQSVTKEWVEFSTKVKKDIKN